MRHILVHPPCTEQRLNDLQGRTKNVDHRHIDLRRAGCSKQANILRSLANEQEEIMLLEEARNIIEGREKTGYMIRFEWYAPGFISSDCFPGTDEPLFNTEAEAWLVARKFAEKTAGKCRMIFVADQNGRPVAGYREKMLNRPDE